MNCWTSSKNPCMWGKRHHPVKREDTGYILTHDMQGGLKLLQLKCKTYFPTKRSLNFFSGFNGSNA